MTAKFGVEISVYMLVLSFSKDSLHYDLQLIFIDFKSGFLLHILRLALGFSVTEHQTTQLGFLLVVVVWCDLVEPKTDVLAIVLWATSEYNVYFRLHNEFN
jgi:hypothetical protein